MRSQCYQEKADGLLLFIRLIPNAAKDEIVGLEEGADGPLIKAKVRAIPDKGKANKALIELAARWLGTTKSQIELKAGSKSRNKTLNIEGDRHILIPVLLKKLAG